MIAQKPTLGHTDLFPILDKVMKASDQISTAKALGMDGIPAELFKAASHGILWCMKHNSSASDYLIKWVNIFIPRYMLHSSSWPAFGSRSSYSKTSGMIVVSLYGDNYSKVDCRNYRGISLISFTRKILPSVIFNHLVRCISQDMLLEAQHGFWANHSTSDRVRQAKETMEQTWTSLLFC